MQTNGQMVKLNQQMDGRTGKQSQVHFIFFFQDSVKIVKSQHSLDIECKTRDLIYFGSPPKSSGKLPITCTNLLFLLTF